MDRLRELLNNQEVQMRNANTEAELAKRNLEDLRAKMGYEYGQHANQLESERQANSKLSAAISAHESKLSTSEKENQELKLAKVTLESRVLQLEREKNE